MELAMLATLPLRWRLDVASLEPATNERGPAGCVEEFFNTLMQLADRRYGIELHACCSARSRWSAVPNLPKGTNALPSRSQEVGTRLWGQWQPASDQ